jgi:hypothetical protein
MALEQLFLLPVFIGQIDRGSLFFTLFYAYVGSAGVQIVHAIFLFMLFYQKASTK